MNNKNDYIRHFLGVDKWHEKGYTGKRGLTLTAENGKTEHSKKTLAAFKEIAPDREVIYQPFYETQSQANDFCEQALATGADTMYMSISSQGKITGADILDNNMPKYLSFFAAAGNYGNEGFNTLTIPKTIYSVGACTLRYSKMVNGKPTEDAELLLQIADYSSSSEYVDFSSITELYVDNGKFDGTSCSTPVLCGMSALINDFFIDKIGRPLTSIEMYQFLIDCSYDIEIIGQDNLSGFGIPILPDPDTINISKYKEGNNNMTCQELITLAMGEIGVKENPKNSNNVKYNTAYYGREVNGSNYQWCLVFIWWLFNKLNASQLFYGGQKTASCTTFYKWYEAKGMTVNKDYRPGDIVFYDWDKSGDCDHVGLLVEINGDKCKVVEGNTAVGNDSNGGEVMLRDRTVSQFKGAVRLSFETEDNTMDIKDFIENMTNEEAYKILEKAQNYLSSVSLPTTWDAESELKEAIDLGITDGTFPSQLTPRYQTAIMIKRAIKK